MASSNQKVRTIRFGIETEWILRPKTPDLYFERGDVYNGLEKAVAAYNKHLDEEEKDSGYTRMVSRDGRRLHEFRSFNKYVLSIDPSVVETDEDKKLYAFAAELITPVLFFSEDGKCLAEYISCVRWFEKHYEIIPRNKAGTHVHISMDDEYSLEDLQKVAVSIIVFEPAILALLPEYRRGYNDAKSNWANNNVIGAYPGTIGQTMSRKAAILRLVKPSRTRTHVIHAMNPDSSKQWAWNFRNLLDDPDDLQEMHPGDQPIGTIEFRQAPTSTTVEFAIETLQFVAGFVQSALDLKHPLDIMKVLPTVKNLKKFVIAGCYPQGPGFHDPSRLDHLWARAGDVEWLVPVPFENPDLTLSQIRELRENIEEEGKAIANFMVTNKWV